MSAKSLAKRVALTQARIDAAVCRIEAEHDHLRAQVAAIAQLSAAAGGTLAQLVLDDHNLRGWLFEEEVPFYQTVAQATPPIESWSRFECEYAAVVRQWWVQGVFQLAR